MKYIFTLLLCLSFGTSQMFAGNPDRQGEAGAYELLMTPWARTAGLHTMNASFVSGVEAMRVNIAGLSRINKMELAVSNMQYLVPSDVSMNAIGIAQRVSKGGVLGISIASMDFGDIPVTTTDLPEGTGATYSPSFFHIAFSYAHTFENKVSVGILFRGISEAISDVNAFGFAFDAGVQYVTGPKDNFKFGIALRNIGAPMQFGGQGLAQQLTAPNDTRLTYNVRAQAFELPSLLNIGVSYDFYPIPANRLSVIGNFTANSFSRDNLGGGLEYSFNEMFMLRAAYKWDIGSTGDDLDRNVYSGIAAGATIQVPLSKTGVQKLAIDYAYRVTNPFMGSHNLGIRLNL
jgi:hypothetical protein